MKVADSVCFSLYKRDNKVSATSLSLSGTQFSTLNSAGMNDPEEPEKYHTITTLK
jgi:hypothetical protein